MLDRRLLADSRLESIVPGRPHRLLPDVTVLKIGGQSVMDRGAEAVLPVVDQIIAARDRVPMIICPGAGTRARHAYHIGLSLGMSPGILARLGSAVSKQNARILQMLLSRVGSVLVEPQHFEQLPAFLAAGQLPIMNGMPPFDLWMRPPVAGRIPDTRTDAGIYLLAETLGAAGLVFVKDEDTIYDDDPKKGGTRPIPTGDAAELRRLNLPDFIVERIILDFLPRARFVREFRVVSARAVSCVRASRASAPAGPSRREAVGAPTGRGSPHRMAPRRPRADEVLAFDPAGDHADLRPRPAGQAPLADRAGLPGAQGRAGPGPLREARLARLSSSRRLMPRGLCLPRGRAREAFPP
jgi:molybdenum storage protein